MISFISPLSRFATFQIGASRERVERATGRVGSDRTLSLSLSGHALEDALSNLEAIQVRDVLTQPVAIASDGSRTAVARAGDLVTIQGAIGSCVVRSTTGIITSLVPVFRPGARLDLDLILEPVDVLHLTGTGEVLTVP